jgi:hypothetical protein
LHREIEANPDKVKAIEEMCPPHNLKEMQRLARCMVALGRFIARSGEKALPFFKLMKCTKKFEWTLEVDKAFAKLKRYLTSPPIMAAPRPREPLLLYIAATPRNASAILIAERDAQVIAEKRSTLHAWGLLLRRRPRCPLPLVRSHPMRLPRLGHSLKTILMSLLKR